MTNYWVSFWMHEDQMKEFECHAPWWRTGFDLDGNISIVIAVQASDEEAARAFVIKSFDTPPSAIVWRFVETRKDDWSPFSGRWPQAEWMLWPITADVALTLRQPNSRTLH